MKILNMLLINLMGGGKIVLFISLVLCTNFIFAQSGQKYADGGNDLTPTSILGSNNYEDLNFYTNSQKRMILTKDGNLELLGNLQINLFGGYLPGGLVGYDKNGRLKNILFTGNSNDVLLGDGTFSNSLTTKYWRLDGDNMYNKNIGFVGIGTSNPQALLDVNGNSIIRGTLFVYNGIIVGTRYEGEKVDVDTIISKEMEVTEKFKVQAINIDGINSKITSTTGLIDFGNTNLKTNAVLYAGGLNVTGYTEFSQLKVNNILQIGNSTLYLSSIQSAPGGTVENSIYTTDGDLLIQCQHDPINNFNTIINANNTGIVGIGDANNIGANWYDAASRARLDVRGDARFTKYDDESKYVRVGFNGANGIIDTWTGVPQENCELFINVYSGNNVRIGSHNDKKNVDGGLTIWENVGIGTEASTDQALKLHIKGYTDIGLQLPESSAILRIEDEAYGSNNIPSGDRTAWWDLITSSKNHKFFINASSNDGINNSNVMTLDENGNVGIGANQVYEKFQIGDDWTFHQDGTYAIARNFKYDGDDKRIHPGIVSRINFNYYGDIIFQTAPDGPLANPISWTHGLCVKNDGKVGIGTLNPTEALEIEGKIKINDAWRGLQLDDSDQGGHRFDFLVSHDETASGFKGFGIFDDTEYAYRFIISEEGNIGIGTEDIDGYKLAVNGAIIATDFFVKLYANWPDYIFDKDYKLPSLAEVEAYINKYKHLPEIPAANEIEKNGYDLATMNALLIKKVEELTLYLIEQDKKISDLQNQINKSLK